MPAKGGLEKKNEIRVFHFQKPHMNKQDLIDMTRPSTYRHPGSLLSFYEMRVFGEDFSRQKISGTSTTEVKRFSSISRPVPRVACSCSSDVRSAGIDGFYGSMMRPIFRSFPSHFLPLSLLPLSFADLEAPSLNLVHFSLLPPQNTPHNVVFWKPLVSLIALSLLLYSFFTFRLSSSST